MRVWLRRGILRSYLGTRNVLLWVLEVTEQVLLAPHDACRPATDQQAGIGTPNCSRVAPEEAFASSQVCAQPLERRLFYTCEFYVAAENLQNVHASESDTATTSASTVHTSHAVSARTGTLVGSSVGEALSLARLAAEQPMEIWALLVALRPIDLVALQALGLESLGACLGAPLGDRHLRYGLGHL
jgi:hypothetical protein